MERVGIQRQHLSVRRTGWHKLAMCTAVAPFVFHYGLSALAFVYDLIVDFPEIE